MKSKFGRLGVVLACLLIAILLLVNPGFSNSISPPGADANGLKDVAM
jgi:hypothetical protein